MLFPPSWPTAIIQQTTCVTFTDSHSNNPFLLSHGHSTQFCHKLYHYCTAFISWIGSPSGCMIQEHYIHKILFARHITYLPIVYCQCLYPFMYNLYQFTTHSVRQQIILWIPIRLVYILACTAYPVFQPNLALAFHLNIKPIYKIHLDQLLSVAV